MNEPYDPGVPVAPPVSDFGGMIGREAVARIRRIVDRAIAIREADLTAPITREEYELDKSMPAMDALDALALAFKEADGG